jgi:hypothetical protein
VADVDVLVEEMRSFGKVLIVVGIVIVGVIVGLVFRNIWLALAVTVMGLGAYGYFRLQKKTTDTKQRAMEREKLGMFLRERKGGAICMAVIAAAIIGLVIYMIIGSFD